jgi:replication factor A1
MSMLVDEIYHKLLESGISEHDLEKQIQKKEKEYGGFMSKQGILFIIAKENGIHIQSPAVDPELYSQMEQEIDYDEFAITIAEVKEGMVSIVLVAKILKTYPVREFSRKDGSIGMVSSCMVGDTSGDIKLVLWDDQAKVIESEAFQEGQIVRVIGDYAKQNPQGNLEIHIGKKGKLILEPQNIDPTTKKELKAVKSIARKGQGITKNANISLMNLIAEQTFLKKVQGEVKIIEFKEITKKDGDKIFLLKLMLNDESGAVPVNIWGMNAVETLKMIEDGVSVIIRNMAVKFNSYTN